MEHATAIKGFIGGLWAVDPSWMKSAIKVLQGHKGEIPKPSVDADFALFARSGDRPAGTRYTVVQDRTAVIDLYGAVMPRANFFSEWSGGISCELMAKDVLWAINDSFIDNILFVAHSPGGEVTGVSELSEMIYQARSKKNITAYISGMGCSAAYWIASACEKVYANNTAILGSIGVMSVYVDDSKAMEMAGFEEIEFISSQSPYKNADPASSEGKKRIQARVDSLAQVFIETVARNRGVDTAKVLKNFGQGDVFIGADAVKAGLADQIGNFGDALALIAGDAIAEPLSTLAVDYSNKGETTMSEEKKPQAAEKETVTVVDNAEVEKLQKMVTELTESNKALEAQRLLDQIDKVIEGFHGDKAAHKTVMQALAANGTDSDAYKAYVTNQTALAAQIDKGELLKTVGSDKGGDSKSALEQLNEKAEAIAKAKGISTADAFAEAAEANQELYEAYNKERQAAKASA